jgi:hypothetical protein
MGHKVEGFNAKEQKIFNKLLDGEDHDIRELKKLFWKDAQERCKVTYEAGWGEHEVNGQAQSYVRNSIRRLVRDGWVKQTGRGTYRLSTKGKERVKKGVTVTKSKTESRRGKGGGRPKTTKKTTKKTSTKKTTKKTSTKKASAKKSTKKKTTKKASAKKSNGASRQTKKQDTSKLKKMRAKAKIAAAKERLSAQA